MRRLGCGALVLGIVAFLGALIGAGGVSLPYRRPLVPIDEAQEAGA